jgi:hypothetical protein
MISRASAKKRVSRTCRVAHALARKLKSTVTQVCGLEITRVWDAGSELLGAALSGVCSF